MIRRAPNLRKLHLIRFVLLGQLHGSPHLRFNDLNQLEDLSILRTIRRGLPLLPCTLRNLSLNGGEDYPDDWKDWEAAPGTVNLEHLESLEISNWLYPEEWFEHILSTCKGKLRHLSINTFGPLSGNIMRYLDAEMLRPLEVLKLPSCVNSRPQETVDDGFQDHHAARLAQEAPNLQELDLSMSRVTGVGIKALVHKVGKPLKRLEFVDWNGKISFDAVTYARNHGIEVVFTGQDGKALKGKSVRNW